MKWLLKHFATDPKFQFIFQAAGTVLSALLFIIIPVVYILDQSLWISISWLALILITDWGNFVTDYQGVAAAEASGHSLKLRGLNVNLHHKGLNRLFERIGIDPHFQYRAHLLLTYNWFAQSVVAVFLYTFAHPFFNQWDSFYCVLQNNYTNFGTGLSALPDTRAAMHLLKLRKGKSPWES